MEYETKLRESGNYTELEIQDRIMLMNCLKTKLMKHHELYRIPVKAESWEDIWDQCINPNGSNWIGGGHQPGADTRDETSNVSYQNKSGQIKGNHVEITSHRLAKQAGPTFDDKLDFISQKHCDNYVLLSRDEKDWKKNIKSYNLMIFDSMLLDFRSLEWSEHIPSKGPYKGKHNGGYIGKGDPDKFSARIDGSGSSNQLHISINMDYIGGYTKIIIP
jgi:hypothetical protein